ncbi:MAG: HIT family protein [Planctomycetes bacterium]|nr:HIT family protein [Planctomycetota bacterium]
MNPDCIFCRILARKAPASFVTEDAFTAAFMDLHPINPGHVLVVPKTHAVLIQDLPDDAYAQLMAAARRVCAALGRSPLAGEGTTWYVADGPPHQEVPHVHVHLVPRHTNDGFRLVFPPGYGKPAPRIDLDRAADMLRALTPAPP